MNHAGRASATATIDPGEVTNKRDGPLSAAPATGTRVGPIRVCCVPAGNRLQHDDTNGPAESQHGERILYKL